MSRDFSFNSRCRKSKLVIKFLKVSPAKLTVAGDSVFCKSQNLSIFAYLDTWSNDLTYRLNKHSCKAGKVQRQTTLLHKLKSGTFTELGHMTDIEVCVLQCCESKHCELALFKNNFCYGITCYSAQHCKTVPAYDDEKADTVFVTKANLTKQGKASLLYCIVMLIMYLGENVCAGITLS